MLSARFRFLSAIAAACLFLATSLAAQQFLPRKILFVGDTTNQAALLAASGLKLGVAIGPDQIRAGAQKLLDTGLFTNVQFGFDGQTLTYKLTPADGLEPVLYANFPWWDSASLTAAVEAKVPLFHGSVIPESGLQQQVAEALTALLAQKGVQAVVTPALAYNEHGAKTGVSFHIDSPGIEVGTVKLAGVDPAFTSDVDAIETAAGGQDFDGSTQASLAVALQAVYHRQGYLSEDLTGFAHGQPELSGGKVLVPVTATVAAGPQYRVAALTQAPGGLLSAADFARLTQLHPGDVANEDKLHTMLAMVVNAYQANGYIKAEVAAPPVLDSAAHTVSYAIAVTPGPLFHMGQLTLVGLNDSQRSDVLRVWPLHPGDVYNSIEVASFLVRHKNELHSLDGWSASYRQIAHLDTDVVDLVVTFHQGGPLR